MKVYLFKRNFARPVREGVKCQTVRACRRYPPTPGERLSLRQWTGQPYRSNQVWLRDGITIRVASVEILADGRIECGGRTLTPDECREFAQADGFESLQALVDWFQIEHGFPFNGELVVWTPCDPKEKAPDFAHCAA